MKNKILLSGAPNSGKTTLFNALTGSQQKVGNYPGVTVEKKEGSFKLGEKSFTITDLPGAYSLNSKSLDEKVATDILKSAKDNADLLIHVVDATNLHKTIGYAVEVMGLGVPVVIALNMMDEARLRGLKLDLKQMSDLLGAPVVELVAAKKEGIPELKSEMEALLEDKSERAIHEVGLKERFNKSQEILSKIVKSPLERDIRSHKIDKVLLHPFFGAVILLLILVGMFEVVYTGAAPFMDLIEEGVALFGELVRSVIGNGLVSSLLVDGIIGGVGSVLVFLPQIMMLFFMIGLLESTGYMARAAFIMDRFMRLFGLEGRAFVPLLSSFACAIPGMMAARTLASHKQRLITIAIAPLMSCSARLPVYVLLISAFIPNTRIGPFNMQSLAMVFLFFLGLFTGMIVAFVMKYALKGEANYNFILELPSYRLPQWKNLYYYLRNKFWAFMKKAGTTILVISIVLWFLSTYPQAPEGFNGNAITYSFAGRLGAYLEPLFRPLGFDWRISTALIPGFGAREVLVSALGTIFSVENAEEAGFTNLRQAVAQTWSVATGLSLLVWYVYAPQCLATFAVMRKEAGSRTWTAIVFTYTLVLAYLASFITYHTAVFFGL